MTREANRQNDGRPLLSICIATVDRAELLAGPDALADIGDMAVGYLYSVAFGDAFGLSLFCMSDSVFCRLPLG